MNFGKMFPGGSFDARQVNELLVDYQDNLNPWPPTYALFLAS